MNYKMLMGYIVLSLLSLAIPVFAGLLYNPYIAKFPMYSQAILGITGVLLWLGNMILVGNFMYYAYKSKFNW